MATILVVDDLAANREVVVSLLKSAGHRMLEAADGRQALSTALAEHPHLVITDVLMPVMDGFTLVKELRRHPVTKATPIVFYTAHYSAKEARDLAVSGGVSDVLIKPVEPSAVLQVVERVLSARSEVTQPREPPPDFDREHLRLITDKLSETTEGLVASNSRLRALINIGLELASEHDGQRLVTKVCEAARDLFAASYVTTGMIDRRTRSVEMVVSAGVEPSPWVVLGEAAPAFFREVIGERRTRIGLNPSGNPVELGLPESHPVIRAFVVAPIASPSHVYGWICLAGNDDQRFNEDDQQLLLALAGQVGRIYENGYYYTIAMRRAEELQRERDAVRLAEERMRFALDSADIGIWEMDYGTGALKWSETLERHYGLTAGAFAGTFEAFIDRVYSDDRPRLLEIVGAAMTNGEDFETEHRTQWPDGTIHWLVGRGRILLDPAGKPLRGVGISLDVTKRQTLEAQYLQAQKMEAVGQLAGGVAHDFNNLLTCILGYCELMLGDLAADEKGRAEILEIQKAGGIAAGLTKQLLSFSRKQIVEPKSLDVNIILDEMRDMVTRLIGEDVAVTFRLAPTVPAIVADRGQIEQIVLNLAVNARDAMPAGGRLTIETADVELDEDYAETHFDAKPGRYASITVTDTGTGIPPDVLTRLFEPFFTTKEQGKGTGLGLATVHGIVTRFGGSVGVYSELGEGTAFTVYFPHDGTTRAPEKVVVAPVVERARGPYTVLVVDDSDLVRQLATRMLERQGYRAMAAANADEAIRIFRDEPSIDVLLSDVVMPGASGPEMTSQLIKHHRNLKVVYMSGYTEDAITRHGVLNPGIAFLHKPFTSEVLGQKLREVLDQRASQ